MPVLSTFWGDPTPYVARAHATGVKVIDQVGSLADAQRAARAGVDVIVAQGMEAGGDIAGEVTTRALVLRIVDAVAPIPVVAASRDRERLPRPSRCYGFSTRRLFTTANTFET